MGFALPLLLQAPINNGKGKGLQIDHDQQCFTILEITAMWHKLMAPQHIKYCSCLLPTPTEELDPQCS